MLAVGADDGGMGREGEESKEGGGDYAVNGLEDEEEVDRPGWVVSIASPFILYHIIEGRQGLMGV